MGFIKAKTDIKMFMHMLTVECTNLLCSNISNTIQHCSLSSQNNHNMHYYASIVLVQLGTGQILGLLICLILILICHSTHLICFYAHYKHMQQCLACIQIPAPKISYAGVKRSDLMGVLLSWERLSQSAIIWECVDEYYYAAAIWY